MIKLLNKDKQTLHLLTQVKEYYIESDLETADKIIHFLIPRTDPSVVDIEQEIYLQTIDNRFVIKEINYPTKDYVEVFGKLDVDDLKATKFRSYESVEKDISFVLDEILPLGWTYSLVDIPAKNRTLREENINAFALIVKAMNTYGFEVEFDTLNKVVRVKQLLGSDRGAYVYTDLNIRRLDFQSDTYEFATRLYAYGKDNLTFADINNGKEYVENFTHSDKVIEEIWVDDRYTVKENLLADATERLAQMAKPRRSYSVEVLELAQLKPEYTILSFGLGDVVRIIDKDNSWQEDHRIVKLTEYPLQPERNIIQLANKRIIFQDNGAAIRDAVSGDIIRVQTELMAEIVSATEMIKAGNGGNVVIRYNETNQPYEILMMDTMDINTAQSVWRWNINGLGHSSTGYSGNYELAILANGSINANFITTGSMSAARITTGILKSSNNLSYIDLNSGYFNLGNMMKLDANGFSLKLNSTTTVEDAIATAENSAKSYTDTQLNTFADEVIDDIDALQSQIDGSITTWFYNVPPSTTNEPAVNWTTTEQKNVHLGDLYYDTFTGYAYRWQVLTNNYSWQRLTDSDVTKALADAAKAQDTADAKRRVFVTQPVPPYEIGDLWVQGTSGDIMRSNINRVTGTYNASDWIKASKYTDDTTANANLAIAQADATDKANAAQAAAEAHADAVAEAERVIAEAYADGIVSAEEQARIDAVNAAVAAAATDAANKADAAEAAAKTYAEAQATAALNSAKTDATAKANAAQDAAIAAANAKAEAERVLAEAYADGIVTAEEQARIDAVNAAVATAATDATNKANAALTAAETYASQAAATAQSAAESHADAKAEAERVIAEAYADGIVDAEEQARIADVNAKLAAAKTYADTTAATALSSAQTYADTAASNAETAASAYADTVAEAKKVLAEAYADGIVDAEEQARIADVNAKLAAAKTYAEEQAQAAEDAANAYIDSVAIQKEDAWIKSDVEPSIKFQNLVWIDTSVEPNVPKRWVGDEWFPIGVTTAADIGAYTSDEAAVLAEAVLDIETSISDGTLRNSIINSDAMNSLLSGKVDATTVGSMIEQSLTSIRTTISEAQTTADNATADYKTIEKYMDFSGTGLLIGRSDSNLKVNITNEELQFLNGTTKVAYVSGNNLNITQANITQKIKIGVHELEKHDANITILRWVGEDN